MLCRCTGSVNAGGAFDPLAYLREQALEGSLRQTTAGAGGGLSAANRQVGHRIIGLSRKSNDIRRLFSG
jgi:hypothetical protein